MLADIEPAGSYDEIVDLLDRVRIARGLSFERLDELSGLASDHAQKALGPARAKSLSPMLIDALLPTLGVRLVAIDDPEAIAAIERRWEHRDETNVRVHKRRVSRRLLDRARPVILEEFAARLALAFGDDIDQMVAGITATRTVSLPPAKSEAVAAIPALPPAAAALPALPPQSAQNLKPAKVEALRPRSTAQMTRSHLRVIQPAHKGVRFGGQL
jgi:hypothetical protein